MMVDFDVRCQRIQEVGWGTHRIGESGAQSSPFTDKSTISWGTYQMYGKAIADGCLPASASSQRCEIPLQ